MRWVVKMQGCENVFKLKRSLKIGSYTYRLLCRSLMVTEPPKPTINKQKIKRKEFKHNTKNSHQITMEDSKKRGKE